MSCRRLVLVLLLSVLHVSFVSLLRTRAWPVPVASHTPHDIVPLPPVSLLVSQSSSTHDWAERLIRTGRPLRICVAAMRASDSWMQFHTLKGLLLQLMEPWPGARLATASGARVEELQECLSQRYCLVRVDGFLPDVLARVHVVFSNHRDPRSLGCSVSLWAIAVAATASWEAHACLVVPASAFEGANLKDTVATHAESLGASLSTRQLAHITSNVRQAFTAAPTSRRKRCSGVTGGMHHRALHEWLVAHGYTVEAHGFVDDAQEAVLASTDVENINAQGSALLPRHCPTVTTSSTFLFLGDPVTNLADTQVGGERGAAQLASSPDDEWRWRSLPALLGLARST